MEQPTASSAENILAQPQDQYQRSAAMWLQAHLHGVEALAHKPILLREVLELLVQEALARAQLFQSAAHLRISMPA